MNCKKHGAYSIVVAITRKGSGSPMAIEVNRNEFLGPPDDRAGGQPQWKPHVSIQPM